MTTLRKATPADLDPVLSLIAAVIADMQSQGIDQWDDIYPDRATLERDIAEQALFLAIDDSIPTTPQALIVLNETESREYETVNWQHRAGKILVVHRLAVHPAHYRRGLASRLMDFAEAHARRHAYAAIRLDTFVGNPAANQLYLKRGYRFAGIVGFRKGLFNCYEKPMP